MSERQLMLGHRVELRQQLQRRTVNCEALRDKLRGLASAALDAHELERDAVLDTAAALHAELGELMLVAKKLSVLGKELGE